ncbi:MAG: hypothetical protein J4F33_08730 [Alphaproteobacteria bacterium]|nr:hypothetical protein [Alphaproteobacteria bacterium]
MLIASGFATVMVVLALLWGVCVAVGLGFRRAAARAPATAADSAAAASGAARVPAQDLPAIIAAAAVAVGRPFRIVDVAVPAHRTAGWNQGASFVHMTGQRMPWDRITFVNEGKRRSIRFW